MIVRLEVFEHFRVYLELDGVVGGCDGRHIPINIVVGLDTFNPLCIDLNKQVDENAKASDEEANQLSCRLLMGRDQARCLYEQVGLIIALFQQLHVLYAANVHQLPRIQGALLPLMAELGHLLPQRMLIKHLGAVRMFVYFQHVVNGLLVAVLVRLELVRYDAEVGVRCVDQGVWRAEQAYVAAGQILLFACCGRASEIS
jgi:hypothetical protein